MQALLDDFVGPNIDTAAALVENAGRYLYLVPEGHTRMANMLEVRLPDRLLCSLWLASFLQQK